MSATAEPKVIAIFGPTAVGKTGVALALAELLRRQGVECVAVNADSMQIYQGLEILSAAPSDHERAQLVHRLVGIAEPSEEFSVGRYAPLAHAEIDRALRAGAYPLVVGGTGLYVQGALRELELRPPIPEAIRSEIDRELDRRGSHALHAELPEADRERIHPNDRKRIARTHGLRRAGIEPAGNSEGLWDAEFRHPTQVFGITLQREELHARIGERVEQMIRAGAFEEARQAASAGLSRTAREMIGIDAALASDPEQLARDHRRYARRQLTWMRKMRPIELIDRTGLDDRAVAELLGRYIVG